MPRPHPPEFRRRAVELARLREKPVAEIARDLGISDSCLRNWMAQADIEEGRRDGVSCAEREELIALRREVRTVRLENEILKRAAAYFARENVLQNDLRLHRPSLLGSAGRGVLPRDEGVDLRLLRVARRAGPDRDLDDAYLTNTILDIHRMSRRSYGSPRVHAELRLGRGTRCSRKRVERLMRVAGIQGIHRRRSRGCTHRDPAAEPAEDLVNRAFDPAEADCLWVMDVTEHPTTEGKVYLAVVLDAFSRRAVGWSIADHMRSELVVDAVQMAIWRRRPTEGRTIAHSDHGSHLGVRAPTPLGRPARLHGFDR